MDLSTMTRGRATAALFGVAAIGVLGAAAGAQTLTTVRLATVPTDGASAPYYAKDLGYFAKTGLDVEISSMGSASAIAAAVTSGAVDIGYSPVDVLASVHEKGIPVVVITPASEYLSPGMTRSVGIVVPANSSVQQAKDLNGKIVASNGLHSFGEEGAKSWIDHNGGDSTTIKWVELPFPAMAAALDAGRVDAVYPTEPFLAASKKIGRVLGYGYDTIAKHFVIGTWYTTPQWAKDHQDVVVRFRTVMHDTAVWANANQGASGEILAKYLKIEPATVATMVRSHYAEQISPALMQPLLDVSAKYNGFKSFPAQELIYQAGR